MRETLTALLLLLIFPLPGLAAGTTVYVIDGPSSRLEARIAIEGVFSFLAHDHLIAAGDFQGKVWLSPESIVPLRVELSLRADSLHETRKSFSDKERLRIDDRMRKEVLETARYPTLAFQGEASQASPLEGGGRRAAVSGELTLHGVTRKVTLDVDLTLKEGQLRARGQLPVTHTDYGLKRISLPGATVAEKVLIDFDIVARPPAR